MITLRRDNVVKQTESEVVALALESQGFVREGAAKKATLEKMCIRDRYGLTERWVRFILFGKLDNLDDDMEGQMSIYDYPEAF